VAGTARYGEQGGNQATARSWCHDNELRDAVMICAECHDDIAPGDQVVVMDGQEVWIVCFDCKGAYDNDLHESERRMVWEVATEKGLVTVAYRDWDGQVAGRDWLAWDSGE
jgi:hypothetical protein